MNSKKICAEYARFLFPAIDQNEADEFAADLYSGNYSRIASAYKRVTKEAGETERKILSGFFRKKLKETFYYNAEHSISQAYACIKALRAIPAAEGGDEKVLKVLKEAGKRVLGMKR